MTWRIVTPLALLAALAMTAAATAQETAPPSGQELFQQRCAACHGEQGWATRVLARRVPAGQGALENRDLLPAALVRLAVRRGIGSMPPIRRTELSDADLAAIATYLEDRP